MAQLIHGKNPVFEAFQAGRHIERALVAGDLKDPDIKRLLDANIPVVKKSRQALDHLCGPGHQGIAAYVAPYQFTPLKPMLERPGLKRFVMLDGITDPHNVGAILRTAEAFGFDAMIIGKHRTSPINATVVKVSTGAIETLPLIQVTNLAQTIETLKAHHCWVYGLDIDTPNTLESLPSDTSVCLVLGSEGAGLSSLVKKRCDALVTIPMFGQTNSLNVSVAAGIAMHQLTKAR